MQQTMYLIDAATSGGLAGTNSRRMILQKLHEKLLPMIRTFSARLAPSKAA